MSQKGLEVFTSIIRKQNLLKGTVESVTTEVSIRTPQGLRFFPVGDFTQNDIGVQVEIDNGKVSRISSKVSATTPVYNL